MKFTIVVATYNRAQKVKRCVESVLAQTYQDFELLVIDDGSNDDTRVVMQAYLSHSRIRFIELGKNHGAATAARNRGIEEMTGEALIIWDSDDELYPGALEELARAHTEHPDAVFVCANTDWVREGSANTGRADGGENRMLSYIEWFCGKRPKQAEIISIKRFVIGNVRFKSRGIDFMFYNEILGSSRGSIYYLDTPLGKVNLESDPLSLTLARRKPNTRLSRERGPLLADFLEQYGWIYLEHCSQKYAPYAYGAAVGLLLGGDSRRARKYAKAALRAGHRWGDQLFYVFVLMPFSSLMLRAAFALKEEFTKTR